MYSLQDRMEPNIFIFNYIYANCTSIMQPNLVWYSKRQMWLCIIWCDQSQSILVMNYLNLPLLFFYLSNWFVNIYKPINKLLKSLKLSKQHIIQLKVYGLPKQNFLFKFLLYNIAKILLWKTSKLTNCLNSSERISLIF